MGTYLLAAGFLPLLAFLTLGLAGFVWPGRRPGFLRVVPIAGGVALFGAVLGLLGLSLAVRRRSP